MGIIFAYKVQKEPKGIGEAFILGDEPELYSYDNSVIETAKNIKSSQRGKL